MSIYFIFLIILAASLIIGGIMLIKQSAKKFNLTEQQLKDIKARNKALDEQEKED
ncbi:MAG: DUF2897 family protein [Thalassotalea sp.]